jgi:hydroxymethylglutaryl-CoA reductase (NADPH)
MSSSDVEQEPHPASSISSRRSSASIGTPKEVRTVEECIEILNTQEVKNLTDDEILQLIDTKNIRAFELEKILRDHLRGVEIRRKMVMRQTNTSTATMKEIPYRNYDYERVLGACAENVIGYMTLPLGVVGPLKINNKVYTVPMATTEGCLLASTNRGCSALRSCGVKTVVTDDKMTRAPAVRFESIHRAAEVKRWIEDKNNMDILKVSINK